MQFRTRKGKKHDEIHHLRHWLRSGRSRQRAYEERLRKKRYYALDSTMDPLDGSLIVPKIVWDAVEERQK